MRTNEVQGVATSSKEPRVFPKGQLVEVFASIQGEGPLVGTPTQFVRVAGCPLRCRYCDTVNSYRAPQEVSVLDGVGRRLESLHNPASVEEIPDLFPGIPSWLSLTGGEPLDQPEFAEALFRKFRGLGKKNLLETAAHNARKLSGLLPFIDLLSMDYKLPSTLLGGASFITETGSIGSLQAEQVKCLEKAIAAQVTTSVKIVLTPGMTQQELSEAFQKLLSFREFFTLVLQPVSPAHLVKKQLDHRTLKEAWWSALSLGFDTLVLPQVHRQLDWL